MLLWMAVWFIGVVPASNVSMVPSRSPEMGYVYVQPADTTVSFGECPSGVRLSVMVDSNVAALHSFSLSITFDSSVVESNWDSILPGSIFPDTLFPYMLGDIYNGDSIHIDLAIMGQGMHVNGPGEILSLWFKPKIGETDIDIIDAVSVLRDTVMPMGNPIPHYCIDGHITVLRSYVYVQPADTTVYLLESPSGVRLSVMVDSSVAALHSFSLSITFDSSVVESNWDSILPGSIFPDTLFPYMLGDIYNGDSIHVDLAIMGQGMHVNGPGEILSLWFKPKIGETDIDIIDAVSVLRDTVMPMGNPIPHYCIDGHITVLRSPYDYDVAIEGIPNEGDPAFVGDTLVALILDPYVTVCNRTVPGGPILSFRVWCKIINNEMGYITYSRHVNVWNLAPQECRTIYFPSGAFFMYPGIYVMVTTIQVSFDDPDLSNNVSLRAFYVPPYRAGSEEETALPAVFALEQNHPNPVRGKATIRYQIPERRTVSISVYDISGREVKTLVIGPKEPGYYSVSLDTKELPQGIYLVKMKAGSFKGVQRMIILK